MQCKYNVLINNKISDNYQGLDLIDVTDNMIFGNTITYNEFEGINLDDYSNNNIFVCNNISLNNRYGVRIGYFNYCINNIFYHNNFINNAQNAYDKGSNSWDNGYPSGGNYWDDYTGIDADGDGIGDTPYYIPGGDNEDGYPLIEPWINNPPNKPTLDGPTVLNIDEEGNYTASATDPDSDQVFFYIDWGDGNIEELIGPYDSGQEIIFKHSWSKIGNYELKVQVIDINGDFSNWSDPITVLIINNPPNKPFISGPTNLKINEEGSFTISAIDSDANQVFFYIEWGDGNVVAWDGPYESDEQVEYKNNWTTKDTYIIRVQAKDIF
jgi:parallel beta-helix repeat protein